MEDNIGYLTMLGTWAAAFGSIIAAVVALWIASRSRKQYIKAEFVPVSKMIATFSRMLGKIVVVNKGHVPVKIRTLWLVPCIPFKCGKWVEISTAHDTAPSEALDYGQEFSIEMNEFHLEVYSDEFELNKWYFHLFANLFRFDIVVETTISCVRVRMNKELTSILLPALRAEASRKAAQS